MNYGYYQDLEELQEEYPEADFSFLENEVSAGSFNPYSYLHGCCYEFAWKLNELFGYTVRLITDLDGNELIHAYCTDGAGRLIDVRGWTDDYETLVKEFAEMTYIPEQYVDFLEKFSDAKEKKPRWSFNQAAYNMATCIIAENPDFYSVEGGFL